MARKLVRNTEGNRLFKYYVSIALINSIIALVITAPIFISEWNMSRVIALGSAGTWFTMGYLLFFIIGIGIIPLCGIIYYIIQNISTNGIFSLRLGMAQLVLLEIAVLGECLGLYYFGFAGGSMLLAEKSREAIHAFLVQFANPAGVFIALGLLGAILGIINYIASIVKIK